MCSVLSSCGRAWRTHQRLLYSDSLTQFVLESTETVHTVCQRRSAAGEWGFCETLVLLIASCNLQIICRPLTLHVMFKRCKGRFTDRAAQVRYTAARHFLCTCGNFPDSNRKGMKEVILPNLQFCCQQTYSINIMLRQKSCMKFTMYVLCSSFDCNFMS